ncbi:hypothetical protein SETIT_9G551800v2 [Setaria italica]|uniref:Uncharacterized protein n=1 Tax=Setaria italica TaxID=4555 RepID=A0A368SYS1_SETIT|nr:hypothetical protein SETIT_9G551800v2 [Setaria italica]
MDLTLHFRPHLSFLFFLLCDALDSQQQPAIERLRTERARKLAVDSIPDLTRSILSNSGQIHGQFVRAHGTGVSIVKVERTRTSGSRRGLYMRTQRLDDAGNYPSGTFRIHGPGKPRPDQEFPAPQVRHMLFLHLVFFYIYIQVCILRPFFSDPKAVEILQKRMLSPSTNSYISNPSVPAIHQQQSMLSGKTSQIHIKWLVHT